MFGQRAAGVDPPHIQRAVRQHGEGAAAADVGDLEPDALLGADAHHREVVVQRDAGALQRRDGDEAGHHAGGAVEIAAVRHRVEMRADNHALRIGVAAGQRHVEVGGGVVLDAQAELLSNRGHRRMRALFARAVRIARHARFVEAVAAKLVEQRCRQFALCRNC